MPSDMAKVLELFGLKGKVAVITGAANGIGRGIATLFDEAGADVVAADMDEAGAKDFASSAKGKATGVKLDQADRNSVRSLFELVEKQHGHCNVLINCAGIYPLMPFEKIQPELLTKVMSVNLNGPFYCTQEAVVLMKKVGGGSIVNISSVNSKISSVLDNIHYDASKAAVNGLTHGVAIEYAQHNIRVNAVMPGAISTPHAAEAIKHYEMRGPILVPGRIPMKGHSENGVGEPLDIATACLFFASDASRYVTGQIMSVDGGFLIS